MAIAPRDLRLLYQQSGNRCALPPITLTFARRAGDIIREVRGIEPLTNFKYYICGLAVSSVREAT